jgi:hypothetical protein
MNIIVKIEANDEVYWKTDSFWSSTKIREYAKIHSKDSLERLIQNLLYSINYIEDKSEMINFYNNCKIGYDFVNKLNFFDFEFVKTGQYEYKLKYNIENNKFELIDIRRREKLKNIERTTK